MNYSQLKAVKDVASWVAVDNVTSSNVSVNKPKALAKDSVAIGPNAGVAPSATNAVALGAGSVATEANTVSVGSVGKERRITNVAPGVRGTDAVNVNQLRDVDNKARGGIAGSTAMANLPQAYLPGHSMVAVAAGTHRGANAVAVGVSRISDSGHVVIKLSGSTDSKGGANAGIGVGYQW